jgi:hypothetical protein
MSTYSRNVSLATARGDLSSTCSHCPIDTCLQSLLSLRKGEGGNYGTVWAAAVASIRLLVITGLCLSVFEGQEALFIYMYQQIKLFLYE